MWLIAIVVAFGACSRAPTGALGTRWGDDSTPLHPGCAASMSDPPFEECELGRVAHLDRHPQTTVISEGGRIAGVRYRFEADDCVGVQAAIADAYHVEYTAGATASPYAVFGDDELVYFKDCRLVVAGSRYGKHFVERLQTEAWGNLVRAFQVH